MPEKLDTKVVYENGDWMVSTETDTKTGKKMLFILASGRITIHHGLENGARITLEG